MKVSRRILVAILVAVFVSASITAAYIAPILTTEIDPNLGKSQCPGGKDWDLPGSSCHYGLIIDRILPAVSEEAVQEGIRRGDIVNWTVESRKNKRGR